MQYIYIYLYIYTHTRMWEKLNLHHNRSKKYIWWTYAFWSMVSVLLPCDINKNARSVNLQFPQRIATDRIFATTTGWSSVPRFPKKHFPRFVARHGCADWDSYIWFMYVGAPPHIFLHLGNSGTVSFGNNIKDVVKIQHSLLGPLT
jgi:hypothetical protein